MPHALERDGDDPEDFSTPASMASEFLGSYLARALAGVDTALWDLRGKREGKSVCELAGGSRGRCGSTAPTSAAADSRRTSRTLVRERDAHGYSAFKVKIGRRRGRDMDEWPGRTRAVIRAVREALGDAVELLADANAGYGPEQAIEVGRLLERHGFTQFEEPCPHQELEWTARVAEALDIEVAGGEQDHDLAQVRRMLDMRAVDVLQPDVCYAGGFTQALRAAALADAAGFPATLGQPLAGYGLRTASACRGGSPRPLHRVCRNGCAPVPGLFHPSIEVRDGRVRVPEGPGWGWRWSRGGWPPPSAGSVASTVGLLDQAASVVRRLELAAGSLDGLAGPRLASTAPAPAGLPHDQGVSCPGGAGVPRRRRPLSSALDDRRRTCPRSRPPCSS